MVCFRYILLIACATGLVYGCAGERLHDGERHFLPTQAAEFYLGSLPSAPMETNLYRSLSSSTRARVSFPHFASSLAAFRPSEMGGGRSGRVTIVEKLDISGSRSIIYALFQWPSPAVEFSLVRVDCRLEGDLWKIELAPSDGSFRPVDVILEGSGLDGHAFAEVRRVIDAERAAVERDLERRRMEDERRAASMAREESLADLIILGKGCYNNGRYRKAIMAFHKALRLDPQNDMVRGYLDKCREALRKN